MRYLFYGLGAVAAFGAGGILIVGSLAVLSYLWAIMLHLTVDQAMVAAALTLLVTMAFAFGAWLAYEARGDRR